MRLLRPSDGDIRNQTSHCLQLDAGVPHQHLKYSFITSLTTQIPCLGIHYINIKLNDRV